MKRFLFPLAAVALLAACSSESPGGNEVYEPIQLDASQTRAAHASQNFALSLVENLQEGSENQNMLVSPLSAHIALSMLANGADGQTLQEMLDVLAQGASLEDLNALNRVISDKLAAADKKVQLFQANSFWYTPQSQVKEQFRNDLTSTYGASLFEVANLTKAIPEINSWIAKNTNNMIPEFFSSEEMLDCFALINANAFLGEWSRKFSAAPADYEFYFRNAGDGQLVKAQAMKSELAVGTREDDTNFVWVPYGNGTFSMVVMLTDAPADNPYAPFSFKHLIQSGTLDKYLNMTTEQKTGYNTDLIIPKFKLDVSHNLESTLWKMGMKSLFSGNANLSKMFSKDITDLLVKQKNSITVDENGTKAASATVIGGVSGALPEEVIIDRPFGFIIMEQSTGLIIYAGAVNKL